MVERVIHLPAVGRVVHLPSVRRVRRLPAVGWLTHCARNTFSRTWRVFTFPRSRVGHTITRSRAGRTFTGKALTRGRAVDTVVRNTFTLIWRVERLRVVVRVINSHSRAECAFLTVERLVHVHFSLVGRVIHLSPERGRIIHLPPWGGYYILPTVTRGSYLSDLSLTLKIRGQNIFFTGF